ncbi:hypothetical protein ACFL2I_01765, partial [Candidatus Omnitrophota bacterium]
MKKILIVIFLLSLVASNSCGNSIDSNAPFPLNNQHNSSKESLGASYNKPLPNIYVDKEIKLILKTQLPYDKFSLLKYPYETSEEINKYTKELTKGLKTDLEKSKAIFSAIIEEDKLGLHFDKEIWHKRKQDAIQNKKDNRINRTAIEVFEQRKKTGDRFATCFEATNLFLAMARAAGINAYLALIIRDYRNIYVHHVAGGITVGNNLLLIDPDLKIFDVLHKSFILYDDFAAIALHLSLQGGLYYEQNDLDSANKMYNLAIEIHPDCIYAYNLLGILQTDRVLFDDAIGNFNKVLKIKDDFIEAK